MKIRKSPSPGVMRPLKSGYRVAQESLSSKTAHRLRDSLGVDLNKGRFDTSSSGTTGIENLKIKLGKQTEGQLEQTLADIGRSDPEAAIPVIEHLSFHKDEAVRKRVAASLGEFDYEDIVDTLMRLLNERSPEVRRQAGQTCRVASSLAVGCEQRALRTTRSRGSSRSPVLLIVRQDFFGREAHLLETVARLFHHGG